MHGPSGRPAAEPYLAEGRQPGGAPRVRRCGCHAVQRVLHHTHNEQRVPGRHGRLHVRGRQPGAQRRVHRTPERQRYAVVPKCVAVTCENRTGGILRAAGTVRLGPVNLPPIRGGGDEHSRHFVGADEYTVRREKWFFFHLSAHHTDRRVYIYRGLPNRAAFKRLRENCVNFYDAERPESAGTMTTSNSSAGRKFIFSNKYIFDLI